MSERILIYEDNGKRQAFLKDAEATRDAANALILTFQEFQEFKKISSLEDFERLCSDPVQFFDETIKAGVSLKIDGGRQPDQQILADLFGIERQNYISVINGLPITEDCKPCKTSTVIKRRGKPALSYCEYNSYRSFLTFEIGAFSLNTEVIAYHLEEYKAFAETAEEVTLYNLFASLVRQLNEYITLYPIGGTDRQQIAKALRLQLTKGMEGDFRLNDEYLKNEITALKYKKNDK